MLPGLRAGQGTEGDLFTSYLRVSGSVFLGVEKGGSGKNYS